MGHSTNSDYCPNSPCTLWRVVEGAAVATEDYVHKLLLLRTVSLVQIPVNWENGSKSSPKEMSNSPLYVQNGLTFWLCTWWGLPAVHCCWIGRRCNDTLWWNVMTKYRKGFQKLNAKHDSQFRKCWWSRWNRKRVKCWADGKNHCELVLQVISSPNLDIFNGGLMERSSVYHIHPGGKLSNFATICMYNIEMQSEISGTNPCGLNNYHKKY